MGPVFLPVDPRPVEGPQAEAMRRWGADPALGHSLINGLSDAFRVVAFDYEGHVMHMPKPDTLTPANPVADLLAVADAAGADRFAYYGYSWLALAGLQLAIRTDRLSALVMGGYPPVDGPYAPMLQVTMATHEMAMANAASAPGAATTSQSSQEPSDEPDWSTVEMSLTDRRPASSSRSIRRCTTSTTAPPNPADLSSAVLRRLGGRHRLRRAVGRGHVDSPARSSARRAELEALGWDVRVLDGLDHCRPCRPAVLPVLRPWLVSKLGTSA